jgi:uncharacterized membrane protein YphA (DoxX/SURF4 family)
MRIVSVGHVVFTATIIALGILGLIKGDFTPMWQQIPGAVPTGSILAYLCALISLTCGVASLWQRAATVAVRVLLASLLIWFVLIRAPEVWPAPTVLVSWYSCAETAVIIAAVWVLYVWFATDWDNRRLSLVTAVHGLRIARILYAASLVFFGVSHFVYVEQTTPLVPSWLPWHLFWAYFTGAAYIAAGAAILTGVCARLAAPLAAVQIGLFTLLVWVPIVAAGTKDPFQWSETILSWTLTAAAWVIADSYYVNLSRSSNQSS